VGRWDNRPTCPGQESSLRLDELLRRRGDGGGRGDDGETAPDVLAPGGEGLHLGLEGGHDLSEIFETLTERPLILVRHRQLVETQPCRPYDGEDRLGGRHGFPSGPAANHASRGGEPPLAEASRKAFLRARSLNGPADELPQRRRGTVSPLPACHRQRE
jgi:hypothetical protein